MKKSNNADKNIPGDFRRGCKLYIGKNLFAEPVDDMSRANIRAVAALDALCRIDLSKIVNNGDSVRRAFTLALHAADAAVVAHLCDLRALVMVAACGHDLLALGDELDDALRAGVGTCTAANAAHAVDLCNAVNNMDSVELADLCAVAKTNAGKGAGLVALAAEQHCGAAIDRAGVVEAELCVTQSTGAGHKRDHLFYVGAGNAHDLSNFCGSLCAARNTLVGGSFTRRYSGGVAVTAGITAAAAVCAGEACTDLLLLGININVEYLGGVCQQCAEQAAQDTKNENREKN